MKTSEITNPLFRKAVESIDSGDLIGLQHLLNGYPELVSTRLHTPEEGYFKNPYLMWFIPDNPIRNEKLTSNITEITRLIIQFAKQHAKESYQEQIDYTLGLTETGRIPKECGVQIELIDLLIECGATPGNGHGALMNGNIEAAKYIIEKSGIITLTTACCLDYSDDIQRLLLESSLEDKQIALMATAFYGKPEAVTLLIQSGANVNGYINHGFHSHASPLHQAVFSRSFETVKLLVEAGANLEASDKIYNGTPLGWAQHMQIGISDELALSKYKEIEAYLLNNLTDSA